MQIPFADALLSRLGRRETGLERLEEIEDEAAESVDADDLPSAEPALLLQRMENRLIRHHLAEPDVLSAEELRRLRYILNFARLADFEPGAAGPGGSRGRGDVSVGAEIAPWRSRVADALYGPLREEPDPITALQTARDALGGLAADQDDQRQVLIERHGNDFSAAELDAEVGYKKLVTILGGGGGAGFVYIGGMQRLLEAGQVPDYMIGASIGSILGSLVSRELPVPIEEYVAWAKTVSYRAILGPERLRRRHGLAGMFALRFDQFAHAMLSREDGQRMRMSDLAIPFDIVVGGVRRQPYTSCRRGSAVPHWRHCRCDRCRFARSASARSSVPGCGKWPPSSTYGSSNPSSSATTSRPATSTSSMPHRSRRPFPVCCIMKRPTRG